MDNLAACGSEIAGLEPTEVTIPGSLSYDAEGREEIRIAVEVLTGVDLGLLYSSEKLLNLDNLLMHVSLLGNVCDNNIEYDNISLEYLEKAMEADLLHCIVKSEVKVVDNFMNTLQALIADARSKISACPDSEEKFILVKSKLHDTEETLRQSRDHVLEMKMELAKLQMTSLAFNQNGHFSKKGQVSGMYFKPELQSVEKQHILRMLERSLARELDLEKKLTEIRQNEEDLRQKLWLTEQVALGMEEAAEGTWARFLEAENTAVILMGISKEMVGRLHVAQLNLDTSTNREQLMNRKLQEFAAQLNLKDMEIGKICSQLSAESFEVALLKTNISMLEEQLRESMSKLEEANVSYEASQEHIEEMESIIESMKETIHVAESRAENAEDKVNQLTETNLELTEEINFLKGSNDRNSKKLSALEKQSRDLELQLQHARASSEASQEQQNLLYSAIWDMEILIDELKQKVSTAESQTLNAEEKCSRLSEANLELSKNVEFLKTRVEFLVMSLDQATVEKMASAKDINIKSNVIMDMVMQLAMERKRIEEKFHVLAKENKLLAEKLTKAKKREETSCEVSDVNNNKIRSYSLEPTTTTCEETSHCNAAELPSENIQNLVVGSLDDASAVEAEMQSSNPADYDSNSVQSGRNRRIYIWMAICILLLSVLAAYFFDNKDAIFKF